MTIIPQMATMPATLSNFLIYPYNPVVNNIWQPCLWHYPGNPAFDIYLATLPLALPWQVCLWHSADNSEVLYNKNMADLQLLPLRDIDWNAQLNKIGQLNADKTVGPGTCSRVCNCLMSSGNDLSMKSLIMIR